MSIRWAGITVWVCFVLGMAPRAARAQTSEAEAPAPAAVVLAPPPSAPAGVTLAPQPSEAAPVSRLPPAFPAPGDQRRADTSRSRHYAGRPWYGNEILISDAVTLSLTGVGVGLANANQGKGGQVLMLGFGGYVLASPIIHGVHERWGIATASLSMRFFIPLAGVLIGASSTECPRDSEGIFCGSTAAIAGGFFGGMALASALDAALFSYENRKPEAVSSSTFGIAPALSSDGKRGEVRAFGTF